MEKFTEIKIVGFDEAASAPSGKGALMDMVLTLSDTAPAVWSQVFDMAWKQHFYMSKRSAYAAGSTITVTCLADELQTQIDQLKIVINQVNEKYKQMLAHADQLQNAQKAKAKQDRQTLSDLKDNLKF